MTLPHWDDDEVLITDIGGALAEARIGPHDDYVAAAAAAFSWRSIDEELAIAELTFDSTRDQAVRSDRGNTLLLTFECGVVRIDIEASPAGITGQLTPVDAGRVTCQTTGSACDEVEIDPVGCFILPQPPSGPVRLHVRTAHYTIATSWICVS